MSQKANLLTVRKKNRIELIVNNSKIWSSVYVLREHLIRIFFLKGVWTLKNFFSFDTNFVSAYFFFFYQNSQISLYKRKLKKKNLFMKIKNIQILNILKQYINKLGYNVFNIKIKNLNVLVDKQKLPFLFKQLRVFSFNIFSRRYNLFIDFLKMTVLFFDNYIDLSGYIKVWARIFKNLAKRMHSRFFIFVKTSIESLIKLNTLYSTKNANIKNSIKYNLCGVKFLLSGRIRGKPRASSSLMLIGNIPTQTLNKKIDFATSHVYTLYGVFGIKVWSYSKRK